MSWWNDIWLNEGFATWMATKPQRQYHADWKPELDEVQESLRAKGTDSLKSTRPIRQKANTSAEINELFDAIAYEKTAAVLRMIEGYVGEGTFQKGINLYIKEHSYANAAAEDFWGAITRASGKPVDKIMSAFVTQAGLPLVTGTQDVNGLSLNQRRYSYSRQAFETGFSDVWPIPVCARSTGAKARDCELLSGKSQAMPAKSAVTLNADGRGYYRSALNGTKIDPAQLTAGERMSLLEDEWALVRVGERQISDFMELASKFGRERESHVIDVLTNRIGVISDHLVASGDRAAFDAWVRKLLSPAAKELGWEAAPNEPDERRALRKEVIFTLGYAGNDPETLQRAKQEVRKMADGTSKLDANMAETAAELAARSGDGAIFDIFQAQMKKAKSPEEYYLYLNALSKFRDPAVVERALRLLLSPEMRNQDAPHYLGRFYVNPDARNIAWEFTKAHWSELQHHMTTWGGSAVVQSTRAFCDAQLRNEVPQFFAINKVPAAERTLAQSTEQMDYCIDLKAQQGPKLAQWLSGTGKAVAAGK
jgi:aminopeptidase N/puromycin-sensitive aminopeptidase